MRSYFLSNHLVIITTLQGGLADFTITVGNGSSLSCHKVIVAQFSPFLSTLLDNPDCCTIILPGFGKSELNGAMNLLYTGR